MVQDLMAITDCFSSRLYGLRNCVWYLFQRVNAAPMQFQFRCHLSLDGVETEAVLPAVIQQRFMRIGLARTLFRHVTLTP